MLNDLRYALRLLLKDRSFTITALLTLIVCIAANTAMFSIVRSVLMKPLPFPESERIVLLYNSYPAAGAPRVGTAVPDYFDRQAAVPALDMLALMQNGTATYGDANGAEQLNLLRATPSFFRLGRLFSDDEGEVGKDSKALLSYGFWRRKFGGSTSVVGQKIRLNGTPYEVVGVLPETFTFLRNDIDVFLPQAFTPAQKNQGRHSNNFQMIGRLRAGATIDQVRQQVDAVNARNDDQFPEFRQILKDAQFHTVAVFLGDDVVRDVKAVLYLLWGGVGFVLLIGCVNIANLIIVRSAGRARELATRHAIGGDLGRLVRREPDREAGRLRRCADQPGGADDGDNRTVPRGAHRDDDSRVARDQDQSDRCVEQVAILEPCTTLLRHALRGGARRRAAARGGNEALTTEERRLPAPPGCAIVIR
jgi:hypothetical protein